MEGRWPRETRGDTDTRVGIFPAEASGSGTPRREELYITPSTTRRDKFHEGSYFSRATLRGAPKDKLVCARRPGWCPPPLDLAFRIFDLSQTGVCPANRETVLNLFGVAWLIYKDEEPGNPLPLGSFSLMYVLSGKESALRGARMYWVVQSDVPWSLDLVLTYGTLSSYSRNGGWGRKAPEVVKFKGKVLGLLLTQ